MKIVLTAFLLFVIVDVLIVVYVIYRRTKRRVPAKVTKEIKESWRKLIRQKDYGHAVMNADKLLDYALGQLGMKGSLGSKLKKSPHLFSDLNGIWAAHKVRNNLAHQINYEVNEKMYKKAMLSFKQAFKDLKIF